MLNMTWDRDAFPLIETLFHTANGVLGVRNSPEEGEPRGGVRGTYLSGVYEDTDILYGEKLYGFPDVKQTLCCLPDAQTVRISLDGKEFSQFDASVTDRRISWEDGAAVKTCRAQTPSGIVLVTVSRVVPLDMGGLFAMKLSLKSESYTGSVTLTSAVEGDVYNAAAEGDPRVAAERLKCLETLSCARDGEDASLLVRTLRSGITVCCRVGHRGGGAAPWRVTGTGAERAFAGRLEPGQEMTLEKYAVYCDSRRYPDPGKAAKEQLARAAELGFDGLLEKQRAAFTALSGDAYAAVDGDAALSEAFLTDQWALTESIGTDGIFSVAAKGLSGEGYEGHAFWDAEMYVFPFALWTAPERARGMLEYRCALLPAARENAKVLGLKRGALYPWRTISGTECSGFFPAGSAQYHINGDIAYAFLQYWFATGDLGFMAEKGAAVLVETARAWLELGHMEKDGFRIDCVTGPDEYTCIVNNNFYTNAVAAYHLKNTALLLERLEAAGLSGDVKKATGVTADEARAFREAGERMYYPAPVDGVTPQDDSFMLKKEMDFRSLPRECFPLLLHFHPLYLYRHRVCKQADTVLAHLLFPELADEEVRRKSWAYYDRITTHDSSLSKAVFAMEAARLGDGEAAMEAFTDAVYTDTRDSHRNTKDGLHTASLGGAYLTVLLGFAGCRAGSGGLEMAPVIPRALAGYTLPIRYRGRVMRLTGSQKGFALKLVSGEPLTVKWYGEDTLLSADGPLTR